MFDEVAFGPLQMQWSKEEIVRRVNDTLEFMGIAHLRERSPYRLSGGEKKRVALASVVVLDPDVLLLDEPTATLDPTTVSQVVDLIHQWKGTAKTIVTATHQLDIVGRHRGSCCCIGEGYDHRRCQPIGDSFEF